MNPFIPPAASKPAALGGICCGSLNLSASMKLVREQLQSFPSLGPKLSTRTPRLASREGDSQKPNPLQTATAVPFGVPGGSNQVLEQATLCQKLYGGSVLNCI